MVNNKGYIRNQYHPFIVHHPSFIINRLSRLSPSHTASVPPLFRVLHAFYQTANLKSMFLTMLHILTDGKHCRIANMITP